MLVIEKLAMLKAMMLEGIPVDKADAIIVRYESMVRRTLTLLSMQMALIFLRTRRRKGCLSRGYL